MPLSSKYLIARLKNQMANEKVKADTQLMDLDVFSSLFLYFPLCPYVHFSDSSCPFILYLIRHLGRNLFDKRALPGAVVLTQSVDEYMSYLGGG